MQHIAGVSVYMCGLEIAEYTTVSRENQLKLVEITVQENDPVGHKIAQVLQKLIQYSEYLSCYTTRLPCCVTLVLLILWPR